MKKAVILGVILLVVGLIGFKAYQAQNPEKFQTEETTKVASTETPATTTSATEESTTAVAENPVKISVTPPIGGTMKGVIEVGASGFNAFVVNVDKEKNWELVSKEFGASLAKEGFATENDIKAGLKKYLASIFDKGVAGRNMHFVISSGALKNPKTTEIAKAIRGEGFVVNEVTPEQEGKYALRALLPKDYVNNSFVVDIGSGNTKISWYEGAALKSVEADGAKYYQDGKSDNDVYQKIVAAVKKVPADKRQYCFIIGGVPFKLAQQSRVGEERYTTLASPDSYSAGDDVKIKSGLNIYRALQEGSGTDKFIFDWDANFTIGFLLTLN
jgi:hypothetical protein